MHKFGSTLGGVWVNTTADQIFRIEDKTMIIYRKMEPGEEEEVARLIEEVFDKYVGSGYSEQGIKEFKNYIKPEFLLRRTEEQSEVLLAKDQEKIIGVIELKSRTHISLLFVAEEYQRKGIAKELFNRIVRDESKEQKNEYKLTVNSSPFAVKIYEKMGFKKTGEEQETNGIRFIPMELI